MGPLRFLIKVDINEVSDGPMQLFLELLMLMILNMSLSSGLVVLEPTNGEDGLLGKYSNL